MEAGGRGRVALFSAGLASVAAEVKVNVESAETRGFTPPGPSDGTLAAPATRRDWRTREAMAVMLTRLAPQFPDAEPSSHGAGPA
jgi:hypothetical protein